MMYKTLFILIAIAIFNLVGLKNGFSQAPEAINYQAAVYLDDGSPVESQSVSVKFGILSGSPTGTLIYEEEHTGIVTSSQGLFNVLIGNGTATSAGVTNDFSTLNWGSNLYFLRVEVDAGQGYEVLGTTQFVSVPYALYAKEAGNAGPAYSAGSGIDLTGNVITNTGDNDNDPVNEIQTINITGSDITLSDGGGTITLPAEIDGDITNEIQTLSVSGSDLTLSNGGGTVTIPPDGDGDSSNEIQTIGIVGSDITLSNGGGSVTLPPEVDGDPANEIQTISIVGANLSLSNGGGTITLPPDADGDPMNEFQTISIVGADLTLSNGGGTITLPPDADGDPLNEIQTISIVGSTLTLSNGGGVITIPPDADSDTTNELQMISLSGSDITLSNGGGTITVPDDGDWIISGSTMYSSASNVGVGTSTPATSFDVVGTMKITDGSQGDGRVLISDAAGQTTWGSSGWGNISSLNSTSTNITTTWTPVGPILSFSKLYDNTRLVAFLDSRVYAGAFSGGATGAVFQVRVNGLQGDFFSQGAITTSGVIDFLSFKSIYSALPAGTYSIQVYARTFTGGSTGVLLDPGGWGGSILVKEEF